MPYENFSCDIPNRHKYPIILHLIRAHINRLDLLLQILQLHRFVFKLNPRCQIILIIELQLPLVRSQNNGIYLGKETQGRELPFQGKWQLFRRFEELNESESLAEHVDFVERGHLEVIAISEDFPAFWAFVRGFLIFLRFLCLKSVF